MTTLVPDDARIETKFVTRPVELERLRIWLRLHPLNFYSPFEDRWVNNVYFDTSDYHSFDQNVSGVSTRNKLRYRWYGENSLPDTGVLEVKSKRNQFGWKQHFKVKKPPFTEGDGWNTFRVNLVQQLGATAKLWLDENPVPIIINRYYRRYYVSHDNDIRVTIDTNQSVFDQRYKPYPNVNRKTHLPDTMVIELKYDRDKRHLATQVVQSIPVRTGRNSKYVIGVRSAHQY